MPVLNQRVINQRIYEVSPRDHTPPVTACDVCDKPVASLVSREVTRGKLFVVGPPLPDFDAAASLAFCKDCWPRWLMWRARMGFDLHIGHTSRERCHPGCLARKNGRHAQLGAQMSMLGTRTDGFFAIKSIDGQPTVNGSPMLWGMRLSHFMYRMLQRQVYYESIGDPAEVQRQFVEALSRREALVLPRGHYDGMLIVVEAFESWRSASLGDIAPPKPGDRSIGLHVVDLTHYEHSGAVLGFWNCWGPHWGRNGHGTMSYEYLQRYFHEAFAVRRARTGSPLWNFNTIPEHMTRQEARRLVMQAAPRERIRRRVAPGENWVIEVYETSSPTTGRRVMCVDVQTAVEYATSWGCAEIHLMMNEADATVGPPRAAARLFGMAMGYEWRWKSQTAPRRSATGVKRIQPAAA